jgi:60 kDa SS-A/Ro ribonucleoprotein
MITQKDKIPEKESLMSLNNAGGVSYKITDWNLLDRFLIIGLEKGTLSPNNKEISINSVSTIVNLLNIDFKRVIDRVVDISINGRAYRNDMAIFAIAVACSFPTTIENKRYAYSKVSEICRTGTHILTFFKYSKIFRGTGSGLKKAINRWFLDKSPESLQYQLVKYSNRNDWSMRDLIRLCHPKTNNVELNSILHLASKSKKYVLDTSTKAYEFFNAKEELAYANYSRTIELMENYNFPWEATNTQVRTPELYSYYISKNNMTWIFRNIANISKNGLLDSKDSPTLKLLLEKITDKQLIVKGKVHPIQVMYAMYAIGMFSKYENYSFYSNRNSITHNRNLDSGLEIALLHSFNNVEKTDKKYLTAIDVSGSMSTNVFGSVMSARIASLAIAYILHKTSNSELYAFSSNFTKFEIENKSFLETVQMMHNLDFAGTNCSLPISYSLQSNKKVDCFVTITDNETNAYDYHPSHYLQKYRNSINSNVKNIIIGMSMSNFSVADPSDTQSLDIAGMDAGIPLIIDNFVNI